MIVYQGNNYQIRVGDLLSVAGVPTTTQVIAGTGMTGGGQLTGNVTLSIANGGVSSTQLNDTGVAAGVYGNATDIPVFTVDSTGRVTAATTIPATISGYVPTSTQVIAGNGLTGGGALNGNVTLAASYSASAPEFGFQTGFAGAANTLARSDHKHPAVDLSADDQVDNLLGLGNGGTARSLVAAAGAIVWSGADGLYIGPVGIAGQVLVSGGAGAPTWGSALLVVDQPANVVYAGPAAGAAAPTAFRSLVNADLPASGVTANTYGSSSAIPVLTVNAKGVITSATTASFTGLVSSVNGQTGVVSIAYADLAGAIPTWAIANGGTGQTTASAAFNALSPITATGDLILGNGTNSATRLAIGANGYLLTSNGTTAAWSPAPAGGVTTFSAGTTGFTPNTATSGAISLAGTLVVSNGGTGATTLTGYVKGAGTTALTASATIPNTDITGLGTMSTQNATSVAVTGGAIDGTTIGGTTAAAITGTTVTASTKFVSPNFDAASSAGGALRTSGGSNCLQWGGGGAVNLTLDGPFNMNPANANISIAPTGTGTVTINPATAGTINNMVIGGTTAAAITGTTITGTAFVGINGGTF
jgi:hypothetical protein